MQALHASPKSLVLANLSGWGVNGTFVTLIPKQPLLYVRLIPRNSTPPAKPPTLYPSISDRNSSGSSLSSGAVAGVVVGCIVGAALLLLGGVLLLRCVCYCWGACYC